MENVGSLKWLMTCGASVGEVVSGSEGMALKAMRFCSGVTNVARLPFIPLRMRCKEKLFWLLTLLAKSTRILSEGSGQIRSKIKKYKE